MDQIQDTCEVCGTEIGVDFVTRFVHGQEENFCCIICAGIYRSSENGAFLNRNI